MRMDDMDKESIVKIYGDSDVDKARVDAIASATGATPVNQLSGTELTLHLSSGGLSLENNGLILKGDFTKMLSRLKPGNLNGEMLVKATRIKNAGKELTIVDATAGMGEDSLLLAAAGFKVKLYEYDKVIAALLRDTMERAMKVPELCDIVSRMELFCENSIDALHNMTFRPDVVLLDPMFPERQKSGLIKKKFQLLQQLESPCSDEDELLGAAIVAKPRKIVIKRPAKGPYLSGRKPDYSYPGKAIRYDCLVFANNATSQNADNL